MNSTTIIPNADKDTSRKNTTMSIFHEQRLQYSPLNISKHQPKEALTT
jgi:hypothetical protein